MIALDSKTREAIVNELTAAQVQRAPRARASYDEARALLRAAGVDVSRGEMRLLLALGRDRAREFGLTSPIVETDALPKEFYTTAEVTADIAATNRRASDRDDWVKQQRAALAARRWTDVDAAGLSEVIRDNANARTPHEFDVRNQETIDFAIRWHWNRAFSTEAKLSLAACLHSAYEHTDADPDDDELFAADGAEGLAERDLDVEQLRVCIQNATAAADRDTLDKLSDSWLRLWTLAGAHEHDPALEPLRRALNEGFKACDARDAREPPKPRPEDLLSTELDVAVLQTLIRELADANAELAKAPPRARATYEEACALLRAVGLKVGTSDMRLLLAAGRHRALVDDIAARDESALSFSSEAARAQRNESFARNRKRASSMLAQRQALAEQRWADVDADGLCAFLADGLAPVLTREEQEEEQQDWINFVIGSEWNRLLSKDLSGRS